MTAAESEVPGPDGGEQGFGRVVSLLRRLAGHAPVPDSWRQHARNALRRQGAAS